MRQRMFRSVESCDIVVVMIMWSIIPHEPRGSEAALDGSDGSAKLKTIR
jgi:hypothetical protein